MMNISKAIAAALLVSGLTITLAACEDQGPLEEAGEEMDDTIEDAGDEMEDATDNY